MGLFVPLLLVCSLLGAIAIALWIIGLRPPRGGGSRKVVIAIAAVLTSLVVPIAALLFTVEIVARLLGG